MNRFFFAVAMAGLIGLGSVPVSVAQEPKPDLTKVKEQVRIALGDIEKNIEQIEDPFGKCYWYWRSASARDFVGDRAGALAALAKVVNLRKDIGNLDARFDIDVELAGRFLEMGDLASYREAEQRARQEMHFKDQQGKESVTINDLLRLAHYQGKANDRDAARETLVRALELARNIPKTSPASYNLIEIASVYEELGDRADAVAAIDLGLEIAAAAIKTDTSYNFSVYVSSLVRMGFFGDALRIIALPKMAPYRLVLIWHAITAFDKTLQIARPDFLDRLLLLVLRESRDDNPGDAREAVLDRKSLKEITRWALLSAEARLGSIEAALDKVTPGLEKKNAPLLSIPTICEIALTRHRTGDHAGAKKLLESAFEVFKVGGSAFALAPLCKAQIAIGEINDAARSVAAILPSDVRMLPDGRTKTRQTLNRTDTLAKAGALASLARALAESGDKEQARKRIQESLGLIDAHQKQAFRNDELREPIQELVIAQSEVESMASGLQLLGRIEDETTKLRVQEYVLRACSRINDLKGIETLIDGLGDSREFVLRNAVGEEVRRGNAENVVGWAPRLRAPVARRWAILQLTETLRLLKDPEPARILLPFGSP